MKTEIINTKLAEKLNQALESEMYASHLYRHFATQMQFKGYFGTQSFFLHESNDELTHFQKLVDFLNDVGYQAIMPSVPECDEEITGLKDAFELAFETEKDLLNLYVGIYKENDPIVQEIILDFIKIQRKAVGEYGDLLARLSIIKDDPCGLLIFDQEMKQ
jgi:ferritin